MTLAAAAKGRLRKAGIAYIKPGRKLGITQLAWFARETETDIEWCLFVPTPKPKIANVAPSRRSTELVAMLAADRHRG